MEFAELLARRHKGLYTPPQTLLCLDPGFTTGVAVFKDGVLASWEQITTIVDGEGVKWFNLYDLFDRIEPTQVVCEDYRIYAHKLEQHTFSGVDTLRLIGGIDSLCFLNRIPIAYQMATAAKGFCTDKKLQDWNYWQKGMKHSRDAIRHGCYYLIFSKPNQEVEK